MERFDDAGRTCIVMVWITETVTAISINRVAVAEFKRFDSESDQRGRLPRKGINEILVVDYRERFWIRFEIFHQVVSHGNIK